MRFSIGIFFTLAVGVAQADWRAVIDQDDFTDEEVRYVLFENEDIRLQFSLDESVIIVAGEEMGRNESVFAYVRTKKGLFEPNTPMEWRVDDHPSTTQEPPESRSSIRTNHYSWSPTTLKVWFLRPTHGDGVCVEHAENFFSGSVLRGRYRIEAMARTSFAISLDGMREAFAKAFGNHPGISACLTQTETE